MATGREAVKKFFTPGRFRTLGNGYELHYVQNRLPAVYQKFYNEWKLQDKKPVHWKPTEENWRRNPVTGEVKRLQNCPIPVKYPHQVHDGLWGGEGVVQGLVKKGKYRSPVPRFWVPTLKQSVVYSEILDKYLEVVVTERALKLIDEHTGFDSYLLETPACDINSLLGLKLKRRILLALIDKDFAHDNPKRFNELYEKYKKFVIPREEADWYGLSFHEARARFEKEERELKLADIVPLKHKYRMELLHQLDEQSIQAASESEKPQSETQASWLSKFNPFKKPDGADKQK